MLVMNTSWKPSLKKFWEASRFNVLHNMLKKKPDTVDIPKFSSNTTCLSWIIKDNASTAVPARTCTNQWMPPWSKPTTNSWTLVVCPPATDGHTGWQRRSNLSKWWDTS